MHCGTPRARLQACDTHQRVRIFCGRITAGDLIAPRERTSLPPPCSCPMLCGRSGVAAVQAAGASRQISGAEPFADCAAHAGGGFGIVFVPRLHAKHSPWLGWPRARCCSREEALSNAPSPPAATATELRGEHPLIGGATREIIAALFNPGPFMSIPNLRTLVRRLLGVAGALAMMHSASAQASPLDSAKPWPSRPLRIVVGFAGGSSPDLVARTLAEPLAKALGQPVIVENRPGASGNIAADVVAKATDQHTIGMLINGNMTIAKLLNPATPYDRHKDLAPISLICSAPLVLAAPADAPGVDARAFFAAAREAGNRWSYGTPGVGTVGHLGMEVLKASSGIAPVHVPYLGNPQVIGAMASGQIQLALLPPGLADAQVRAGKLRAIGITSAARIPLVPDYPSLEEAGIKGFRLEIWTAAAAPASLPQPIVQKLSALLGEITRSPEVRQKLFQQGYQAAGTSSEELAQRIKADTALLSHIISTQGVRLE
jgi:tripartite-type tricarboxylate transporter receptor subunit TctC